jgi:hypothetical protein
MKVKDLIEQLQKFNPEDDVRIHPDYELFIGENFTCFGEVGEIRKKELYCDTGGWYDVYKDREEYLEDLINREEALSEIKTIFKKAEILKAVIIRATL